MQRCDLDDSAGASPWICHICDSSGRGESTACSVCYKIACAQHLRHKTVYNPASGLYELQPVCLYCATLGEH